MEDAALTGILTGLSTRAALILALFVTPYVVACHLRLRADLIHTLALTGAVCVALNVLVPITLHTLQVPTTPGYLALAHWMLAGAVTLGAKFRHIEMSPQLSRENRIIIALMAGFTVFVLPFTHLAGIDTYRWQNLATNVRLQQYIPWLIHPVSLFGFTPRSYPSAQPLLLATIQMLGGLGVDYGFFLISVVSGATGIASACLLARRFFENPRHAPWFAFFYAFSPVFMRYNHWATGRGLFLSLFPLFLIALLNLPRAHAVAGAIAGAILLALSHKTGLVAVVAVSSSLLFIPILPRTDRRIAVAIFAVPSLIASFMLAPDIFLPAPAGSLFGLIRYNLARFGCLTPLACIGLLGSIGWLSKPTWRRFLPAMFLTFPIAHARDMYGALIALPFVALPAAAGVSWLIKKYPTRAKPFTRTLVILVLTGALIIVGHRSRTATPGEVREAASFLEIYDPEGPYWVEAPGSARSQIQAYVSGYSRLDVSVSQRGRLKFHRPPPLGGDPKRILRVWTTYLRGMFSVTDTKVAWYGKNPRVYYVLINGKGSHPSDAKLLFQRDGVEIYQPATQGSQNTPALPGRKWPHS